MMSFKARDSSYTPQVWCKMRFSSTGENGRNPDLICKNRGYETEHSTLVGTLVKAYTSMMGPQKLSICIMRQTPHHEQCSKKKPGLSYKIFVNIMLCTQNLDYDIDSFNIRPKIA